ncbi:hypothetical protein FOZ63_011728, partial [Perkinsus olseni]
VRYWRSSCRPCSTSIGPGRGWKMTRRGFVRIVWIRSSSPSASSLGWSASPSHSKASLRKSKRPQPRPPR